MNPTVRVRDCVVHEPGRLHLSWRRHGPQAVFRSFLEHRRLILQLTRREISARYRGSFLGLAWSFLTPMLMLAVYTFVFTVVFQARWDVSAGNRVEFALILFAGLIVFYIFSECLSRAPGLLLENVSYVKRIIFPLDVLAWVAVLSALFNAAVSTVILVAAHLVISGPPPPTILWLPVVLAPHVLMVLGLVWILAPLGVYVRDVRQIVAVILPVFMFASPLFYPLSAVPEVARPYLALNPLAITMEQVRAVALFGTPPDLAVLAVQGVASLLFAWLGLIWFLATKRGFADVM